MIQGEAYFDIVWKQFRKHLLAVVMLWSLAALFLLAILAPLVASEQPFVFSEGGETLYPWFVALLNASSTVDHMFNVALLVLPIPPHGVGRRPYPAITPNEIHVRIADDEAPIRGRTAPAQRMNRKRDAIELVQRDLFDVGQRIGSQRRQ